MNADQLEQYLRATLADKEREKTLLEGEIGALHSVLSAMRQFAKQEAPDAKS